MTNVEQAVEVFRARWPVVKKAILELKLPHKNEFEAIADESYVLASEIGEVYGVSGEEVIKGVCNLVTEL